MKNFFHLLVILGMSLTFVSQASATCPETIASDILEARLLMKVSRGDYARRSTDGAHNLQYPNAFWTKLETFASIDTTGECNLFGADARFSIEDFGYVSTLVAYGNYVSPKVSHSFGIGRSWGLQRSYSGGAYQIETDSLIQALGQILRESNDPRFNQPSAIANVNRRIQAIMDADGHLPFWKVSFAIRDSR